VAEGELGARFSVPTSVAVALLTGRLDETTMNDDVVTAADVVDLARRVRVVHDPSLDEGYPAGRPARVRVTLGDGSERTASADRPRGDADRGFTREELAAKAGRLLASRFGDAGRDVMTAVHALATGGRAREVGTALRRAAAGGLR
jgi:2-methylcitrate dehydratase PrpD